MKFLTFFLLVTGAHGAELTLTSPGDYEVVQRRTKDSGRLSITGTMATIALADCDFEARLVEEEQAQPWQPLATAIDELSFRSALEAPAGGWYRLEVRATQDGETLAKAAVEHVGIGEVFVVAGQSNSANHGEEKQTTQTGRVASFDGQTWQLANDPQPGASGKGGSFMPPLGDALVLHLDVPIGFIPCGIGATSVREWLPEGAPFPNPPTLERRVRQLPGGNWASNGEAFNTLVAKIRAAGPHGFRAVLWHQGESDANQKDPTRTLSGSLYRDCLTTVITQSRKQIGWNPPWFVAQVSYHSPDDTGSPDIRSAQAALWKNGTALEGPDSDALTDDLRQNNGQGVHFSGKGLREHATRWFDKVSPWLEQELKSPTR